MLSAYRFLFRPALLSLLTLFAVAQVLSAGESAIDQEYLRLGLVQKFQGDRPLCWAYAFVNALELTVSRAEGRAVSFDPLEVSALREEVGKAPSRPQIAAGRGDMIEPVLWLIWQRGLRGSNGKVYRNILIELAPGVVAPSERGPATLPWEADRLEAAVKDGWGSGNRAWLLARLAEGAPVVCTLLGWRDGEFRNFMLGHAVVATGRLGFRNSWEGEPHLYLEQEEADECLYANYVVRLGTDEARERAVDAMRAAGERWNYMGVPDSDSAESASAVRFDFHVPGAAAAK